MPPALPSRRWSPLRVVASTPPAAPSGFEGRNLQEPQGAHSPWLLGGGPVRRLRLGRRRGLETARRVGLDVGEVRKPRVGSDWTSVKFGNGASGRIGHRRGLRNSASGESLSASSRCHRQLREESPSPTSPELPGAPAGFVPSETGRSPRKRWRQGKRRPTSKVDHGKPLSACRDVLRSHPATAHLRFSGHHPARRNSNSP